MPSLNTIRNAVGIIGNIISLCLFLSPVPTFIQIWKKKSKKRVKVLSIVLLEIAFIVALLLLVVFLVHPIKKRSVIVGALCVVFCIMIYVAPLSVMKLVIKTKSVEYMPFYLSLASLANGACWTAYALIEIDWNIIIPNGIGVLLAVGQLILYAAFYKSTQRQIAERKAAEKGGGGGGELNLSQVGVAVDRNEDAYFNKAARNGAV
ncbi:Bidirectional sugar transporter SWEET7a [Linum perenne]